MHRIAMVALVTVVGLATACGAKKEQSAGLPDPTSFKCSSDADCVVSCLYYDQSCCSDPCGEPCNDVYHRDQLAALEKWRGAHCDKGCDAIAMADCSDSADQVKAVCVDQVCKAQ